MGYFYVLFLSLKLGLVANVVEICFFAPTTTGNLIHAIKGSMKSLSKKELFTSDSRGLSTIVCLTENTKNLFFLLIVTLVSFKTDCCCDPNWRTRCRKGNGFGHWSCNRHRHLQSYIPKQSEYLTPPDSVILQFLKQLQLGGIRG